MKPYFSLVRIGTIPFQAAEASQPIPHIISRLLNQRSHRKAINDSARPPRVSTLCPVPKPCENNCSRFSEAGWNVNQLGATFGPNITTRQSALKLIGLVPRGVLKKFSESRLAHRSHLQVGPLDGLRQTNPLRVLKIKMNLTAFTWLGVVFVLKASGNSQN
jgi:hypothetical protein